MANDRLSREERQYFGLNPNVFSREKSIPKCTIKSSKRHAWIDEVVSSLIKKKNAVKRKAVKTGFAADWQKFKELRRSVKQLAKENRLCT